jgi:hypothetical protein
VGKKGGAFRTAVQTGSAISRDRSSLLIVLLRRRFDTRAQTRLLSIERWQR